ncbi:hypothetical protein NE237_006911 [Protea cynaroides]|uniref:TF-B3 domain-containing protein n=1 Tax=Protea cynaroides TaxID=273540 RepID=A0A9Q0QVW7_9MAGN|nr:hypothetical protein NE237_006911 [Protea cynaroides]
MGYRQDGGCRECTKKCLSIHGKRDTSLTTTSFFKVLIGDRFSEVLFIPPKFARTLSSVVGKKTYLEDSTGRCWSVKLATVDGLVAFGQGWDKFASDHILEAGHFLVFTYIFGSHFVVQIYDRSGCEKLQFSHKENTSSRKKAEPELFSGHLPWDGRKSVPTEASSLIIDRGFTKEQGSSSTVPSALHIGIINDNVKDTEKTVIAKSTSVCDTCQERLKSELTADCTEDEKEKGNSDISNIVFGQYPFSTRQKFNDLGNKSVVKSKMEETPLVGSSGSVSQIITKMSGCSVRPVSLEGEKGKGLKKVKKEHEEMIKEVKEKKSKTIKEEIGERVSLSSKDKGKGYKAVKTEPMDSDDLSSPDLIDFCYSVTTVTQSWLELPKASVSQKMKPKMERQIVLLRDPAMRKWAVLLYEIPGFRFLTSGWEAFAKANNIQPGDVCFFGVENPSEGLLRVNIVKS